MKIELNRLKRLLVLIPETLDEWKILVSIDGGTATMGQMMPGSSLCIGQQATWLTDENNPPIIVQRALTAEKMKDLEVAPWGRIDVMKMPQVPDEVFKTLDAIREAQDAYTGVTGAMVPAEGDRTTTEAGREVMADAPRGTGKNKKVKFEFDEASFRKLRDGEPCWHTGCLSHITHPCEGCGRIGGQGESREEFEHDRNSCTKVV